MKVEVYTFCWNEMHILPWVIDYWRQYATHVTVFDNGSTDGSEWFLRQFDFIEVAPFRTDGLNDTVHQLIKNSCWKDSDADFVVICDMDECLLAKDIHTSLERMKAIGATICRPKWYELHSEAMPVYEDGKYLHEISPMAVPNVGGSKAILFDPKAISKINYAPGAHECSPEGRVKWYAGDIYCLHINHNLSLEYKIARYRDLRDRLSDENKAKGHGIHYAFSDAVLKMAWKEDGKRAVNLNDIVNGGGFAAVVNPEPDIK